jgi:hypothetical protein
MFITMIARQAQAIRAGEVIAKLAEDAYFMWVDNRVSQVPPSELMKSGTMKPLVAARQTTEATVSTKNTSHILTALGPQLEDPRRVATARAALVVVAVALEVVVVAAVVAVAVAKAHLTVSTEELVAVAITEAKATRTATPPAVHVAAMTLATRSTRSTEKSH